MESPSRFYKKCVQNIKNVLPKRTVNEIFRCALALLIALLLKNDCIFWTNDFY